MTFSSEAYFLGGSHARLTCSQQSRLGPDATPRDLVELLWTRIFPAYRIILPSCGVLALILCLGGITTAVCLLKVDCSPVAAVLAKFTMAKLYAQRVCTVI